MLVNPSDLVAKAKATITECSVREAHECLTQDTLFIDIREPAEFQRGCLPGAVHLPRGRLEFDLHAVVDRARADRNIPHEELAIILYCGTGGRSALAAKTAEEMGYRNVKSMGGGIVAWAQAQLPLDVSA
ncbi:MAG: rhodanese-like domain-containing protein [Gammaproteobacteria bacterium]|nr:rhodanese-like domain-containing protein [Gammaproteobacteria bacterium]MDH3374257.1 rhodanese-like domain-containing protein [Gammaproteobacteria bacterium]MDH3553205.1 rhodanese-like domain-containing protein [Gammaproteobacteria bacterium]